jgi:hypothetical protein
VLASSSAPLPSLYPVAQAGPDNSVLVYSGCVVTLQSPFCNKDALSNAAFFGTLSSSSSIAWAAVSSGAAPTLRYGSCAASSWPHAAFQPDPSYSRRGAVFIAGGVTVKSDLVPVVPVVVFSFDSPGAFASLDGSGSPLPQPRAFSACSMMGVDDYFVM